MNEMKAFLCKVLCKQRAIINNNSYYLRLQVKMGVVLPMDVAQSCCDVLNYLPDVTLAPFPLFDTLDQLACGPIHGRDNECRTLTAAPPPATPPTNSLQAKGAQEKLQLTS